MLSPPTGWQPLQADRKAWPDGVRELVMDVSKGPRDIVWDITYTCPLRCVHCYSESGRRPSRQLSHEDMVRVADALISLRPKGIVLSGGEPLAVRGIFEIADRITGAGIPVILYTGGWSFQPWMVDELARTVTRVSVSVDGATAQVHDRVRGRAGSFQRAMNTLATLDEAARERRARGEAPVEFGLDCTLVRSSFDQMDDFCTTIAPRFPEMSFIWYGPAMPIGLASRTGFVEHEILTDAQVDLLVSAAQHTHLQSLAPASVQVSVTDNRMLQMRPDLIAAGLIPAMQVEPDGNVRAMAIYEGTVGNVLTEPPLEVWQRAIARWSDPVVTEALGPARRIDYVFGTDDDRARIDRRPPFAAAGTAANAAAGTAAPERAG